MRTGIYIAIAFFMMGIINACEKMETEVEYLEQKEELLSETTRFDNVMDSVGKAAINITVEEEDDVDLEFGLTL